MNIIKFVNLKFIIRIRSIFHGEFKSFERKKTDAKIQAKFDFELKFYL